MRIISCILLMAFVFSEQNFNERRIILIRADTEHEGEMEQQVEKLLQEKHELKDRKIAIFTFYDNKLNSIFNTNSDSVEFIKHQLSEQNSERENFSIQLFGLDGSEKSKFNKVTKPEVFFNKIDQMPMRRAELGRQD
ncbi:MAG: DUF4174 domain-containing protein [Psychroflexus sp.]